MNSLIINVREYGFFSSMFQILDNIRYCEQNNMKPIINIGNRFLYQNGQENIWNSFYKPVNDGIIIGDTIEIEKLSSNSNFLEEDFLMVSPKNNNYKLKLWELHCENGDVIRHRNEINSYFNKYMIPNDDIQYIIDDYSHKNLSENVLGVHIRATDYMFHNLDVYADRISAIKDQYSQIFIASDNMEAVTQLSSRFKDVLYYTTSHRSEQMCSASPACITIENSNRIQHGKDVLIESRLLSKCKHLICINSNVAASAAYINPTMSIDLLARQPGGG